MLAKDVMILEIEKVRKFLDCFKLTSNIKKKDWDLKFKIVGNKEHKDEIIRSVLELKEAVKEYDYEQEQLGKVGANLR